MNHLFRVLLVVIIALICFILISHRQVSSIPEITEVETDVVYEPVIVTPEPEIEEEKYVDENPVKIGFYLRNTATGKRHLVTSFANNWVYHKDIEVFNPFYTQEEEIDGTRLGECFAKYMNQYESGESYRVGFHIAFETEKESIEQTIITPKDVDRFYNILEVYLYDGYHRAPGEWYSHTTEEEFNEETIFTGIKLTAGKEVEKITSPITLTVFTYDGLDDFDEDGNYRGNSKYTIQVEKK